MSVTLHLVLLLSLTTCYGFRTITIVFQNSYLTQSFVSPSLSRLHHRHRHHNGPPFNTHHTIYPRSSQTEMYKSPPTDDTEDDLPPDDNDASLHESFRRAANDRLGAPVPIPLSFTANAESDFLRAMTDAKEEFSQARKDTGSTDGAVELVMGRVDREEALEGQFDDANCEGAVEEDLGSAEGDSYFQ